MAITTSAKKAYRQSLRRRVFNIRRTRAMKNAVSNFRSALTSGREADAASSIPALYKSIDKAVKRGVIKKNTAARMKSRLTKKLSTTSDR